MGQGQPGEMYAVAIRDDQLYLWLRIRRTQAGDIYILIPTGREGEQEWRFWNPHVSVHASGQTHQKSFNRKSMQRQIDRPDSNFRGIHNPITRPIGHDEPRAFGVICNPEDYVEVFEIPVSEVRRRVGPKFRTIISVDIAEPGEDPIITPGWRIIRSWRIDTSQPWIIVTILEDPNCDDLEP